MRGTRIRNAKSLAKRVKSKVKCRQIGGNGEDVVKHRSGDILKRWDGDKNRIEEPGISGEISGY